MIGLTITGADELAAKLDGAPGILAARLGEVMARLGQALYARVEENLSGAVLHARSGKLAASIAQQTDNLSAAVGFDPDAVPYGAAQEFGAEIRAHLIEARNAKALAFVVGGRRVFAKRVMFPGAHLPERSFLRAALADLAPDAGDEIRRQ
jgi:phage gpG-like protein